MINIVTRNVGGRLRPFRHLMMEGGDRMEILLQLLLAFAKGFVTSIAAAIATKLMSKRNNKRKRTTPTSTKRERGGSKKNK